MPTRLCAEPRCPHPATTRGRCPDHARTNNKITHANTAHRKIYNSKRWQLLRRRVLLEQPICCGCDNALSVDVDHIRSLDTGGAPYARSNVQGLCVPCHAAKTRQEQMGTRYAPSKPAFLILCGKPGTGKTATRSHLATLTGAQAFGPDDHNGDWNRVLDTLDRTEHAIVECCRLPRALRRKAAARGATVIELTAPTETRRQRLLRRGETPEAIQRLQAEDDLGLGYEDHVEPHMTLSTATDTPEAVADAIAARMQPTSA